MKQTQALLSASEALFTEAQAIRSTSIEEAIAKAQQALNLAQEERNFNLQFDIFIFLGRTFRIQGEAFAAIEHLNKAYRILNHQLSQDKIKLSLIYREYGSLYSDCFGDHAVALDYCRKSLSLNNDKIVAPLYNNIGCQYVLLKRYEKATFYLLKGKEICLDKKEYTTLSFVYENFGQMYLQEKNKASAIEAYQAGIDAANTARSYYGERQEINYIHCYNLLGLAKIYQEAGELEQLPPLIEEVYQKSLKFKLQSCWSEAAIIEGSMFLANNEIPDFVDLFERASLFCTKNALHSDHETWLRKIIDLCEQQEKYKEALEYSKKLIENKADRETKTKAVNVAKVLENKEMEILALENRNRETQLQKDQLEQFAYIVAHDLKTPLSNISNFIGLFSEKYKDKIDEENKYYLDFVQENSKQLHLMFDELLRYITVKKIKEEATFCNLEQIIAEIQKKYEHPISLKQGLIEYHAFPKIKMQAAHLKIIFTRLIENAIKFSKPGRALRIAIDVQENLEEYRFTISDNGIGIAEAYRPKIFDLFKRLDKVNYQGIGMGLAICKKIANIYGGKIDVDANDTGGTTFRFNIPKGKNHSPVLI